MAREPKEKGLSIITALSDREKSKVFLAVDEKQDMVIFKRLEGEGHADLYRRVEKLHCAYFPRVKEIQSADGETLVTEEYLEGRTLDRILEGEVSVLNGFFYLEELLKAVRVLHQMEPPVIHRDVKPENVIITKDGALKLLDFDSARSLSDQEKDRDTACLGTRGYAAPEQFGYQQTDVRSDLYSVGIVCSQVAEKMVLTKRMQKRMKAFLDKATMFDPKERFQSADEMITALKKVRGAKTGKKLTFVAASVAAALLLAIPVWGAMRKAGDESVKEKLTDEWATYVSDFDVLPEEYHARGIGSRVRRADDETKAKRKKLEDLPIPYDAEGADGFFRPEQECAIGTQYPLLRVLKACPQAILIQDHRCEYASIDNIRLERYFADGEKVLESLRLAQDSFEIRDSMLCLKAEALGKLNPGIYLLAFQLHYKEDWEFCRYLQVHGEEEKVDDFGVRLLQPIQYYSPSLDNDAFFYVYNTPWTIRKVLRDGEEVRGNGCFFTLDGKGVILKKDFFEGVDQSAEITIEMENGRKAYGRVIIIP
ncbi:MAG: protein kinase [Lachnospiraceae bacterium]|nr:protein kinase [Lachnospiraceae bacterium]